MSPPFNEANGLQMSNASLVDYSVCNYTVLIHTKLGAIKDEPTDTMPPSSNWRCMIPCHACIPHCFSPGLHCHICMQNGPQSIVDVECVYTAACLGGVQV